MQKYTSIRLDGETSLLLKRLAKHEGRTKLGEVRHLAMERIESLGLNGKRKEVTA